VRDAIAPNRTGHPAAARDSFVRTSRARAAVPGLSELTIHAYAQHKCGKRGAQDANKGAQAAADAWLPLENRG